MGMSGGKRFRDINVSTLGNITRFCIWCILVKKLLPSPEEKAILCLGHFKPDFQV